MIFEAHENAEAILACEATERMAGKRGLLLRAKRRLTNDSRHLSLRRGFRRLGGCALFQPEQAAGETSISPALESL